MKVDELIRGLRDLILNHPDLSRAEILITPHGPRHNQPISGVRLGPHGTKVLIEGEK